VWAYWSILSVGSRACRGVLYHSIASMTADHRIRILTIDDHPLLREGIGAIIGAQSDMHLVGEAASGQDGIRMYRQVKPDITLMDVRLPDMNGIDALIAIRSEYKNARIIILSTSQGDVEIHRAIHAGAGGFLLKSMPPDELVAAIRHVHAGKKVVPPTVATHLAEHLADNALTPRETEILRLIAAGNSNRDVANAVSITEETVKAHVKHILEKLDAKDRTDAVVIALQRGIIYL
jgi:DNA-binding NarL/FixJ family response regulator